ncbi:DUF4326 domain-containing protein [Streptomyces sp. NPDC056529]|uniref:DUF4326 domain-containing protein n=1 Tax=Streptomyces sp. NPDC056529 TaxID=3345855 RepID=UPI0036B34322
MPDRIQRRRTPGWRAEDHTTSPLGTVYVGRPTRFANPARLIHADHGLVVQWGTTGGAVGTWPADGVEARRYATELYENWLGQPEQESTRALFRAVLFGRDLMCWCPLPEPGQPDHCHAAVLLDLANRPASA